MCTCTFLETGTFLGLADGAPIGFWILNACMRVPDPQYLPAGQGKRAAAKRIQFRPKALA